MKLIITDTNILFDVIKIGVLPEFFSLDFDICTTVFVIEEHLQVKRPRVNMQLVLASPIQISYISSKGVQNADGVGEK